MPKIRVLIVDDAVVIRRLLSDSLSSDPDIEIAGTAASGTIALSKIPQLNPDLITLDIEMPGLSGLETLAKIRASYPKLPVIMFSTLTERGGAATLEALALGASDYATKPSGVGSMAAALRVVSESLAPKIKTLCCHPAGAAWTSTPSPARQATCIRLPTHDRGQKPLDVLAIGVSTGGPNALAEVTSRLPRDFPIPILIVQHMPPTFTRLLAERLDKNCPLTVREAQGGETPSSGEIWIAPGDRHLVVEGTPGWPRLSTNEEPPENSCRPAVDVLFRSVAGVYGDRALALVLTGMGQDGLRGAEAIHNAGGKTVVQDEATSVVWGMPGFVENAGLADAVLPLNQIAPALIRRAQAHRNRPHLPTRASAGGT